MFKKKIKTVITWPRSGEFSKWKSHDNNHPELHPGQFDLHRNASPMWAPTWSRGSFSPYVLVSLRICFPMHLSLYVLNFLWWQGKIARKDDKERPAPVWDRLLVKVYSLSSSIVTVSDKEVEAVGWTQLTLFLCMVVRPSSVSTRVTGWMTSGHLQYVISLMTKAHLQYVIEYSGKLASWQKSDGYPPSVCHQVSQQWLDGKGVTEYLPFSISSG